MTNDTETAGRALAEATRSGKLVDAYRILDKRPVEEVQAIAMHAGFSCISRTNRRNCISYVVSQVSAAARNRTDGYGLRELKQAAAAAKLATPSPATNQEQPT